MGTLRWEGGVGGTPGTDVLLTPLLTPLVVRMHRKPSGRVSTRKEWEEFYAFTLWLGSYPENLPIPPALHHPMPHSSSLSSLQAPNPSPLGSPPAPTVFSDLDDY